jgi:amino acid adenylation domain-containing protein
LHIPGLTLKPYPFENNKTKFDLNLTGWLEHRRLRFTVSYAAALFKPQTIERFAGYFKRIAAAAAASPGLRLGDIETLSGEEKRRLLVDFNAAAVDYPAGKTIARLLEEQVGRAPDRVALVLNDSHAVTYREFNRRANRLARALRGKGAGRDAIIGILAAPSLEMITALTAVLKSGGAFLPLEPKHPDERVNFMLNDSSARLVLAQHDQLQRIPPRCEAVDLDDPTLFEGEIDDLPSINGPGNLVYTIYTSGSTGKPKGVLLKQRNLVNYACWFSRAAELNPGDRTVMVSSFGFDLGYTAIFPSLLSGCRLHIIEEEIYLSPETFLEYIERHGISYIKLTPSLFGAMVESSLFTGKRCRCLRLVVLGGEAIKPGDVASTFKVSPPTQIMNHYGPTEATIGCVARYIDRDRMAEYMSRPTIGRPIYNMPVYILDKQHRPAPLGAAGELCITGAGIAAGYLNHPGLTAERFLIAPGHRRRKLYKTGDRARWLEDGNIEFLGRLDHQVKIRGYRVEVGEIENRLARLETIKDALVLVWEDDSRDKHLCAYIVPNGEFSEPGAREFLSRDLPHYMIPSHFATLERIPLTPNGKVNRKALPAPQINMVENSIAPRDSLERRLAEIWSQTLGIEKDKIGIDSDFFQLGGHSLKATVLMSRIHRELDVRVPLTEMFKAPTIRKLALHVKASSPDRFAPIEPVEKKEYYELSFAQKRLFILSRLGSIGLVYNLPGAFILEGDIDEQRLEDTLQALLARHESLRTSFHLRNGKPVQVIHQHVELPIEFLNRDPLDREEETIIKAALKAFVRPFDLSRAPLLRIALMRLTGCKCLLLFDMHHVITDGVSRGILVREISDLYRGETLPPLTIQYKDFAQWQTHGAGGEINRRQERYWLERFKDGAPVLELPADYPRPPVQSFAGGFITRRLDDSLCRELRQSLRDTETTLNMMMLAVYIILLAKYSGQKDIVTGLGIAGRTHPDLEGVIGFFVNVLAIRTQPHEEKAFARYLQEVKRATLAGYENQDYPFDELVNTLKIPNDLSRNPLFCVSFVVQNMEIGELSFDDFKIYPFETERKQARFDLQLEVREVGDSILVSLEYAAALFKRATAEKFLERYVRMLQQVVDKLDIRLKDIEISHDLTMAQSKILQKEDIDFEF